MAQRQQTRRWFPDTWALRLRPCATLSGCSAFCVGFASVRASPQLARLMLSVAALELPRRSYRQLIMATITSTLGP
ncbi:hypothetical protein OG21DRAFT_1509599 [Imleria badia]|nr:hypothetical protein OG21DRAFT_1509599 [Imleria badia]